MSAKPAKVPRVAATAPGTITGAIVEPTEDKKTVGFVVRERLPAQTLNWYLELIYEWLQYLSDGNLTGNHTITGTLGITGNTSITGTLSVSALLTAASGATVTGALTQSGGTTTLSNATVTGLVTANAGVTCGANTSVTVSGSGNYKHTDKFIGRAYYNLGNAINAAGTPASAIAGGIGISLPTNSTHFVSLPELPTHARITGIEAFFDSSVTAKTISSITLAQSADVVFGSTAGTISASIVSTGTSLSLANLSQARWTTSGSIAATNVGSGNYWLTIANGNTNTAILRCAIVRYDVP